MALHSLYGIYLNNLRWHQIQNLYNEYVPQGKAKLKVDRILEIIDLLDELPKDEMIDQYLFTGRTSIKWYRLDGNLNHKIGSIEKQINSKYPTIFENPLDLVLNDKFQPIHAIKMNENSILLTLGISSYRDHTIFKNCQLVSYPSEYFSYAIIRNSTPILEIRSNDVLRVKIGDTLEKELNIGIKGLTEINPITQDQFMEFKSNIPDSKIRKYKGKSIDDNSFHDIFEVTAKPGIDYGGDIDAFEKMREQLEDVSLTISFEYNDSVFAFRISILTGSIYFPTFVSEDAIKYISEIFQTTIWS
ncbi:MAG: hypothetical protein GF353_11985 [Candidatus Lokiarchaeota archaeon]|nr:hypothetical protein [Candidatus Lokiarchaeota archaeon]